MSEQEVGAMSLATLSIVRQLRIILLLFSVECRVCVTCCRVAGSLSQRHHEYDERKYSRTELDAKSICVVVYAQNR